MNRLFTVLALASASTLAVSANSFTYQATPAPGTVPELSTIEIVFPEYDDVDIDVKDDITVTRDGVNVPISVKDFPSDGNGIIVTFPERQVTPGKYVLNIAAMALTGYYNSWTGQDSNPRISLEYTIEGSETDMFGYTVSPAVGEVTSLSTVTLNFASLDEVEIVTADDLTVSYNGNVIEGASAKVTPSGSSTVVFTLPETMTAPGTYEFFIPAGGLDGYIYGDEDSEYYSNEAPITVAYTIAGSADALDFTVSATPSPEGVISNLSKVLLTFPEITAIQTPTLFDVNLDGQPIAADSYTVAAVGNVIELNFNPAITEGKLDLYIPAGGVKGTKGDVTAANEQSISVSYTVAGPVVYDYQTDFSSPTKPNADGEISANKSIASFFFSTPTPYLYCADGTEPNVTIKEVNGDFQASARLRKGNGLYATTTSYFYADFGREPSYNGEYIVTIEQGAYGNSIWFDNNAYGRSNAKVELHFTLVDGNVRDIYTLSPRSVTPVSGTYTKAEDLATVTVTFADADVKMAADATATLAGTDTDYLRQAAFTATETPGVFTATFTTLPTAGGTYIMTVNAGAFGNEAFITSGAATGEGSKAIQEEYQLSLNNGISAIADEAAEHGIYTVTGIYMGNDATVLPAGLYIIHGKKIIVK